MKVTGIALASFVTIFDERFVGSIAKFLDRFRYVSQIGLRRHCRRMITARDILSLGFTDKELRRHFSPLASTIADSIGSEATVTLLLRFGGGIIYIPAEMSEDSKIAKAIGLRPAERLSEDFGPRHITLPNSINGPLMRRALAVKMLKDGHTLSKVATATGVARSTVIKWKRDYLGKDVAPREPAVIDKAGFKAASKPVERVITLSAISGCQPAGKRFR